MGKHKYGQNTIPNSQSPIGNIITNWLFPLSVLYCRGRPHLESRTLAERRRYLAHSHLARILSNISVATAFAATTSAATVSAATAATSASVDVATDATSTSSTAIATTLKKKGFR